jgi:hypothetical protein
MQAGPVTSLNEEDLGQARYEIVFLLEMEGPLTRAEIQTLLFMKLSDSDLIGCLSYLTVAQRIERPSGKKYRAKVDAGQPVPSINLEALTRGPALQRRSGGKSSRP